MRRCPLTIRSLSPLSELALQGRDGLSSGRGTDKLFDMLEAAGMGDIADPVRKYVCVRKDCLDLVRSIRD